jgi:hypothetical protein
VKRKFLSINSIDRAGFFFGGQAGHHGAFKNAVAQSIAAGGHAGERIFSEFRAEWGKAVMAYVRRCWKKDKQYL